MKYSNSFFYDNDFAQKSEDWVNDLFTGGLKVEVKSDRMAAKTGNLYIEIYSRGKPSGLSTSLADYWIYRIDNIDTAIILSIQRLKEIVKINYKGTFKKGGDNNSSLGVLIPIKNLF